LISEDAIEGEFVERGSTLAVRQEEVPAAAPSLFATEDPVEVIQKAVAVADALKAVVVAKGLVKKIGIKEYPLVEGLVMKVSQGGSGNWGTVPMPPNDPKGKHADEITDLVKFEQGLAGEK